MLIRRNSQSSRSRNIINKILEYNIYNKIVIENISYEIQSVCLKIIILIHI